MGSCDNSSALTGWHVFHGILRERLHHPDEARVTRERLSRAANTVRQALAANPLAVDTAIAIGLTVLSLVALGAGAPNLGGASPLNLALLLLQTLPLVLRRRFPIAVLMVVAGSLALQIILLPPGADLNASVGLLVALYTVGEGLPRRMSFGLMIAVAATIGVLMVRQVPLPEGLQGLIQAMFYLAAAWFVGDAARTRRLYSSMLEDQKALLEREREERSRRAVLEERERISRELHDAVSHHVSVIAIHAGAGRRALAKRPDEAGTAFQAIDTVARLAITDMRRMLEMLGEEDDREPVPTLDAIGDLLDRFASAGLTVELSVEGERPALDPGLELSAYRIIQEALTNSLKHAGGGRAHVTIRYRANSIEILVDDERGSAAATPLEPTHVGRGLLGMRERVAMFRGSFAARPTAVGFQVAVRLPFDEATSS